MNYQDLSKIREIEEKLDKIDFALDFNDRKTAREQYSQITTLFKSISFDNAEEKQRLYNNIMLQYQKIEAAAKESITKDQKKASAEKKQQESQPQQEESGFFGGQPYRQESEKDTRPPIKSIEIGEDILKTEDQDTTYRQKSYDKMNAVIDLFVKKEKTLRYGAIIIVILFVGIFLIKNPSIIGFVVAEQSQTTILNDNITQDTSYPLKLVAGPIAFTVSGSVGKNSSFIIMLDDGNESYIILDQAKLNTTGKGESFTSITGLVVDNATENASITESFSTASETISTASETIASIAENITSEEENVTELLPKATLMESEEEIFFQSLCKETCTLTNRTTTPTLRVSIINGSLNLSSYTIVYPKGTKINHPPELLQNFTSFKFLMNENYTIDARDYFSDEDGDIVRLTANKLPNISIRINRSIITIIPQENITGVFNLTIAASDNFSTTTANNITMKIVDNLTETVQIDAIVSIPVQWKKSVQIMNKSPVLAVDIHKEAFNITITRKNDSDEQNISTGDLQIIDEGKVKDISEHEQERKVELMEQDIQVLETKKDLIIEQQRYEDLDKYKEYNDKLVVLQEQLVEEKQQNDLITGNVIGVSSSNGLISRFLDWLFSPAVTGAVVGVNSSEELTLTTDKDSYSLNETVHITVTPAGAEVSMYIFTESENYYLDSLDFTPQETGLHTVSALISYGDKTERLSKEFLVFSPGTTPSTIQPEINLTTMEETPSEGMLSDYIDNQLTQEQNNESATIILPESAVKAADEITLSYQTDAPEAFEYKINDTNKKVIVTSAVHYENILTYVDVPNLRPSQLNLYHYENGQNRPYPIYNYSDKDNDSLIDRIYWITPHLSNQTFEIAITVLNVQSYPVVGGNWTAIFETFGTANMTITAIHNTTYTEFPQDSNETEDDLEFLQLKCGNESIFNKANNTYRNDVWIIKEDDSLISPTNFFSSGQGNTNGNSNQSNGNNSSNSGQGNSNNGQGNGNNGQGRSNANNGQGNNNSNSGQGNSQGNGNNQQVLTPVRMKGIYIEQYNCTNYGTWTAHVLTKGVHNQMITFGNYSAFANNYANNPPIKDIIVFSDGSYGKTKSFI